MDDTPPEGDRPAGPGRMTLATVVAASLVLLGLIVPQLTRVDDPGPFTADDPVRRLAEADGAPLEADGLERDAVALRTVSTGCPGDAREVAVRVATLVQGVHG